MSAIWLGERGSCKRWAAVCVGLIGILVIIRPGFGAAHWALVLPLATAILFAAFQVMARIVGRTDSSLTTLLYSNAVGLLGTSLALPFVWTMPTAALWLMMVGLGMLAAVGPYLMPEAFSTAPASTLAPFTYVHMLWATVVGFLVFGAVPGPFALPGPPLC